MQPVQQFNDPEEPGEWKSGIVEVDPDAQPVKALIYLMFRLTPSEAPEGFKRKLC